MPVVEAHDSWAANLPGSHVFCCVSKPGTSAHAFHGPVIRAPARGSAQLVDAIVQQGGRRFALTALPLWLKQAFAYYQLIHIHPFADGNGRFSRLLVAAIGSRGSGARAESLLAAAAIAFNKYAITALQVSVREWSPGLYLERWQRLYRWTRKYAMTLSAEEAAASRELAAACGSRNASATLFPLLASRCRVREQELIRHCRWSSRNAPNYLARLVAAGWLAPAPGAVSEWTSPRFSAVRDSILAEIRAATLSTFV